MGRPRKDRIGQHAGEFASELRRLLSADLTQAVEEVLSKHERELASLRRAVAALERRVDSLAERHRASRGKVGRWVPGGPGRPPKDAAARIAAFHLRQKSLSSRSTGGRPAAGVAGPASGPAAPASSRRSERASGSTAEKLTPRGRLAATSGRTKGPAAGSRAAKPRRRS
jgi:hypothetical protein